MVRDLPGVTFIKGGSGMKGLNTLDKLMLVNLFGGLVAGVWFALGK